MRLRVCVLRSPNWTYVEAFLERNERTVRGAFSGRVDSGLPSPTIRVGSIFLPDRTLAPD